MDSIVVSVDGRPVQSLWPGENRLPAYAEAERLSSIDLDFDGSPDLALLSELAAGNSRSQYWRQDPRTGRFTVAGEYETMAPDPAARELTTFSRSREGGRLWTAGRWRWAGDVLEPVAEESQAAMYDNPGRYLRAVNRWRGSRWELVRLDTLRESQLRAGPSWIEP